MQESERIKEFAIGDKIGEGTYAEVFKARYLRDNRPCAIKRIKVYEMPAEERKKTQTEVELLKHLHHPNIIEFYEHFVCNTELYIVMELAEEGDLRRILNNLRTRGTPFQEIDIWRSLFSVACGVAFMHDNKIMHRDIKPANIYVTAQMKLKLGDLGLGRVLSTQSMQAQSLVGTPYYMAPEQVQGIPYDFKSDIWSLGCLTYEMAMLHSPFESMQQSNLAALAQSIVNCRYDPLPESYSQILRTLVGMMLHRDPKQRPSATQVVQVVKSVLDQAGPNAPPSGLSASAAPMPNDAAQPMTRTLPKVNVPQQPAPAQPLNPEQKAQAALAEALQAGVTPRAHFTPELIDQMVQLQKARPVNLLHGGTGIFVVFEDLGVMGRGKFSTVNRIAYRTTGKQFAMKQLSIYEMEADDRKECIKEVQLLQALNHPHIIRCYDVFVEEGQLCMVLELADQGDLNAVLNRQRGLQRYFSELEIWHYFLQVVDAIRAMHANRIMHRDVKPGNVFVTADRKLKVGDLGLGRLFGSRTAVVFSVVGTPSYMSPEVLKNQGYNFKSDIWALGCLLYELTALRTPFMVENSGNMYELGNMIIEGRKPPLPDIFSRELHVLVDRMLSLNPDARPTTEEIFQRSYEVYHALRSRQEYGAANDGGSDVNM